MAAVTLFLYGLQSFTRELQHLSGSVLKRGLERATRHRILAAVVGMVSTAVLQSSSAVSTLVIALSDAKLLTLKAALAVLVGANLGTASTAFIVSFKLNHVGAYLLVAGSLLSLMPIKLRLIGKSLFYFGLILFSLDQISVVLEPVYHSPRLLELLTYAAHPMVGVFIGLTITALVQSSSVVTGLVVLLANEGSLSMIGAVAIVCGANIGTTATGLFAAAQLGRSARVIALANLIFNLLSVVLVFPFIPQLAEGALVWSRSDLGLAVALSHLLFNTTVMALGLLLLTPVCRWLQRMDWHKPAGLG